MATVEQMKQLWAVGSARGQPPQARLAARRATSADIVETLFDLLGARTAAHLRQFKIGGSDPLCPIAAREASFAFTRVVNLRI